MTNDFDELIKTGAIDITTREAVENESDRNARAAEQDAYALTYEEGITVSRAQNIIETVLIQNDFVTVDETTRTRFLSLNPESIEKILNEFTARGLDPDELLNLADRVLSGNWYTLLLTSHYTPGNGKVGFYLVANVNGKRDNGILQIEDYPIIYEPGSSRTAQRDSLKLPKNAGFLFSAELDILETLQKICSPQFFIEEKIGYLEPYDKMPTSAMFTFTSRFLNNPHVTEKPRKNTPEKIEYRENEAEYTLISKTRNSTVTLTISDYSVFFDIPNDASGNETSSKIRRGTFSGVKKVWRFALQKLMQQSTDYAMPEYILIDLNEMVKLGMYSNADNAYRGICLMVQKMSLLHIIQDFVVDNGKERNVGGILFYARMRDKGSGFAKVYVNRQFNFQPLRKQYGFFPVEWAYKLSENAFPMAEYIFTLMRQNSTELTQKGKFKIQLSMVQNQLGLPSVDCVRENYNRKYNDYIKKPITTAVNEVNEAAKEAENINGKLKLTIKAPDTNKIEAWLDGYLEISANGEYTSFLASIAERKRIYSETYKEEKVRQAAKQRARSKPTKATKKSPSKNGNFHH